jgi:hypothetical protein
MGSRRAGPSCPRYRRAGSFGSLPLRKQKTAKLIDEPCGQRSDLPAAPGEGIIRVLTLPRSGYRVETISRSRRTFSGGRRPRNDGEKGTSMNLTTARIQQPIDYGSDVGKGRCMIVEITYREGSCGNGQPRRTDLLKMRPIFRFPHDSPQSLKCVPLHGRFLRRL